MKFQEDQRPESKRVLLRTCNEAILTYPLYENLKIASVSFAVCKAVSATDDNVDRKLVVDTILKVLAFPDIQVYTPKVLTECDRLLSCYVTLWA
jgi:hypothetical protein